MSKYEENAIDLEVLAANTGRDAPLAEKLFSMYLRDVEPSLQKMQDELAAGECEALGRSAHSLKGASALIGVGSVRDAALALEMAGKSSGCAECKVLLELLEGALRSSVMPIRTFLDGGFPGF